MADTGDPNAPPFGDVAKPGPWKTNLSDSDEKAFQGWIKQNNIPYKDEPKADYDMRGFWKAQQGEVAPHRDPETGHFPDTYKTPYHKTFSNESKYATSQAPRWKGDKLVNVAGKVIADESKQK